MKAMRHRIKCIFAAGLMTAMITLQCSAETKISPSIDIKPTGEISVIVTPPEENHEHGGVIGSVHVKPTNKDIVQEFHVKGVNPGDPIYFRLYLPDGHYIDLPGEVIDKDTVRVIIPEEGDLVIVVDDESDDDIYTIVPGKEPGPPDNPPVNPPVTPPGTSPQTGDTTTPPMMPASCAAISGLACIYFFRKKTPEREE